MGFTPEQIKGRIKSVAKQNNADARTLMRIYMMERFLERLAQSEYRDMPKTQKEVFFKCFDYTRNFMTS